MPIKMISKPVKKKVLKIPPRPKTLFSGPIECSLMPIDQYSHAPTEEKRYGRYAQSTYSLSSFGKNSYIVVAYIDVDVEKYREQNISDEQIVKGCMEFLNKSPEESKKKKESKKPYGNLQLYNYKIINKFGKNIIAIELVTDSRTNDKFWGTGNR
jgi:hypothetical protein